MLDFATGRVITVDDFQVPAHLSYLYLYLRENRFLQPINNFNRELLPLRSRDVVSNIQSGNKEMGATGPARNR